MQIRPSPSSSKSLPQREAEVIPPFLYSDESLQQNRLDCPFVVAYGAAETDEYRRHAIAFHAALQGAGKRRELLFAAGQNHFEISRTLGDPDGLLFRATIDLTSRFIASL